MTNSMPGGMMDLGTAGGTNAEAYCLNSDRVVVGVAMKAIGGSQALMFTNAMGGKTTIMSMSMSNMSATGGQCWFVNDLGQVAGQAQMMTGRRHAFVSGPTTMTGGMMGGTTGGTTGGMMGGTTGGMMGGSSGGMPGGTTAGMPGGMMGRTNVDLRTLGGSNSVAYCLNNAGMAVGMAETTSGRPHAFMVSNSLGQVTHMMDLNKLIPTNSGWELMVAHGINDAGQIVGWGMHGGHTNAFLLTPVSAPVMMTSAPVPEMVGSGAAVTLSAQMSANEPLTYQWLHDGMAIPGATSATLNLPPMNMGAAGRYTVTVRNGAGTVASASTAVSMLGMTLANGTSHLTVAAPDGSRFRIDYLDMLGSGATWRMLTNISVVGRVSGIPDLSVAGPRARFYRATMLP
jgi:probable HAF family extracellular repeat protein